MDIEYEKYNSCVRRYNNLLCEINNEYNNYVIKHENKLRDIQNNIDEINKVKPVFIFKRKITFVVGPSSFSATQHCRLKDKSLHLTRILFPNFSSNGFTSGSAVEKSSFFKRKCKYINVLCSH